jgi:tetratricopeptide (TPR) repeat protein
MTFDKSSVLELIGKGINAYERSEFKKAIEFYEQALAIARKIKYREGEGGALGSLGNAYYSLGEVRKATEYHEQALVIDREIDDRKGEGVDLGNLGNAYSDLGKIRKSIEYYEQAIDIARDIEDRINEGRWVGNLGNRYSDLGEIRKAIEYYEQSLVIAREIGDRIAEGNALGNLGNAYSDLGKIRKSIEYYEQALAIAREIKYREGEGAWLSSIGEANMVLGDWDKSLQLFSDALKIFETIESLTRQGETLSYIGELQIKSGEWEDARKNLEKSLEIYKKTTPVGAIDVLMNLGELDSVEDKYEEAFSKFQKALTIASELKLNPKKVKIFNKFGRAYLMEFEFNKSQESLAHAKNYCESALKLAKKLQSPSDQGISLRNLGIVYSKYSKIKESKNYFTQSLEIFQTRGARYELARTYLELAKTLAENNELLEAEEKTKVCAFDAIRRNFKELEVRSYMLLGDIVWKQDSTHYGYYLSAIKTAIFNPKIYTRTIFLLIDRMKRMEKDTTIEFIAALKEVNIEVHFGNFLTALVSKIQGKDYSVEGLPVELEEEFDNFTIASK